MGDSPKLNCATCHQGAYKPLNGAKMASEFPELLQKLSTKPPTQVAKK